MIIDGKTPTVGGGVVVQLGTTKFQTNAEVLEIDESDQTLRVKVNYPQGQSKEAWIYAHEVRDVLTSGELAMDNAVNVLDRKNTDEL